MGKIAADKGPSFKIRSSESYVNASHKIFIFNSLGGKKTPFELLSTDTTSDALVKMYVCGLTPYDTAHMGHLVPALRFDLVRNYLEYRNLKVNFVQNVTDIDDKIINRVLQTGEDPIALTERVTQLFYDQLASMNIRMPTRLIRVTESIPEIIKYIEELIEKDAAYATPQGNVYFNLSKHAGYGKLSNQKVDQLIEGSRIESEQDKKYPLDFALWKSDQSSKLSVSSPWGIGRPGWHIECSVMIDNTLGTPIDIHGGGLDLKFPHHENEVAQSEAHDEHEFARYWMHAGLLTIDGTKMSKSLGNFLTIEDAFKKYGFELIRYLFLTQHYRSNVNLSDQVFLEIMNPLWDLYRTVAQVSERFGAISQSVEYKLDNSPLENFRLEIEKALNDDFNTPLAIVAIRKIVTELRKFLLLEQNSESSQMAHRYIYAISEFGRILGLFNIGYEEVFNQLLNFISIVKNVHPPALQEIRQILVDRQEARSKKDFATSDIIREKLSNIGLEYLDLKNQISGGDLVLNLRFNNTVV